MSKNNLYLIIIFVIFSCVTKKNQKKLETNTQKKAVISFISIGGGIPTQLFTQTKALFEKNKCNVVYEIKPWGREGEKDICFQIPTDCYDELIIDIKKIIGNEKRVQIKENAECRK